MSREERRKRREERRDAKFERDRFLLWEYMSAFPSRKGYKYYLQYSRIMIFQLSWLAWTGLWAGYNLGAHGFSSFSFLINLVICVLAILWTMFNLAMHVWGTHKMMMMNYNEILDWCRQNGIDIHDPPKWLW